MLQTETPSAEHADLDRYDSLHLVHAFANDQLAAVAAVQAAAPQLAAAVDAALPRIRAGGRLLYMGAGTSGRLGLLDSVELLPTFSWPSERALARLAGGERAMFRAVEGAEDDAAQGAADLRAMQPTASDVLIGIAASGATPYVLGALHAAADIGCLRIALANNRGAPVLDAADIGVLLDTGSELISGSTRLKAGTAQKIALNTFSSSLMVKLHKVHGNLMVDVMATNAKLRRRAVALTQRAADCSEAQAQAALQAASGSVKLAVLIQRTGLSAEAARTRLDAVDGHLRAALETP